MKSLITNNKGQTLVTLLVFTVVAIAVVSTAVVVMINIARSTSITESRFIASQAAESGIENAIIRMLRDPDYTGETMSVGDAIVVISVSGTDPIIITSKAILGSYEQTVQTTVTYVENRLAVSGWEYMY
ncbi:MAG: hypothetical protein US54_C0062G0007 [Candidatus Roizmanbacteria bacterium GW2011_GWA2_37_7]|uniref:Type 4 fimbrial biogenesis protein PilX N-terminal domain-containing protein n=1 Tax=Candidatus Roizmanbacteria bacterium GW2011_GWA2_37_7 TaxID=1618481 RepID=A0A0G0H3A5_9BACT|nr:MAG: hypothetical protein US54_C0062G0007 [Candidatus Roizmanbacteria bacterium GW2011_GWA2_37_7]